MKKINIFLVVLALLCFSTACLRKENKTSTATSVLFGTFNAMKIAKNDTLHFFNLENEAKDFQQQVTDSTLRLALHDSIFQKLHFDTGQASFHPLGRFNLNETHEACVLYVLDFWFHRQLLLIYNTKNDAFEDAIKVSELYGGESGQIITESWLYAHAQKTNLYQKEVSHWTKPDDLGEPIITEETYTKIKNWNGNTFVALPFQSQDSLHLARTFQTKWRWE